jgi:hypothetical protein
MMDLRTIKALEDEQAERAASERSEPYVPWDCAEIQEYALARPFPFPNIGSYRPDGWKLVDEWLCDKTGWGQESEPALTVDGLKRKLVLDCEAHETHGFAIISEGQFQIVLGVFERTGSPVPTSRSEKS